MQRQDSEIKNNLISVQDNQSVLVVTPSSRYVSSGSATSTFSVLNTGSGTMPWTAAVTSGGSWLQIRSGTSGTGTGIITCSFDTNFEKSSRTGIIRVTATGATGSPKDVMVTQSPTVVQPVLSITPSDQAVSKEVGVIGFSVSNTGTVTMPWTAQVVSGANWLRITSGSSGSNTGTINCAFDANKETSMRTGTVRVTASGATGSPKDVTVSQAGILPNRQPVFGRLVRWCLVLESVYKAVDKDGIHSKRADDSCWKGGYRRCRRSDRRVVIRIVGSEFIHGSMGKTELQTCRLDNSRRFEQ